MKKKHVLAMLLCFVFMSIIIGYVKSNNKPDLYIDFEKATLLKSENIIKSKKSNFDIQGTPDGLAVTNSLSKKGKNSIAFELDANEARRELKIVDIPNNKTKYISFSVFFPQSYEIPNNWNLFSQWWQGAPASPPIAFELEPNSSSFKFRIVTRDGTVSDFNMRTQYLGLLEKNKWQDFIIKIFIDDTGADNGELVVWQNGTKIVQYKGKLGYTDLKDKVNFRIGLYRSKNINTMAKAYYDEVKVGNTFEQVK